MPKKILSLGSDGKLVLKLPDGSTEALIFYPPTALLLVDTSGSMEGSNLRQAQAGAAAFFPDAFGKGFQVGLIQFSTSAAWVCGPTNDAKWLQICINRLQAAGGTNMIDAMQLATDELLPKKNRRAIVVVTDGQPADPAGVLQVAQQAKDGGIEIIAIGTDDADREFLRQLASSEDMTIKVSAHQLGQGIASAAGLLPGPSR